MPQDPAVTSVQLIYIPLASVQCSDYVILLNRSAVCSLLLF